MTFKYLIFISLFGIITGSYYDPHLFPSSGPFMEGWYIRILDFDKCSSFAVLFGSVLPEHPDLADNKTLAYIGVLKQKWNEGQPRRSLSTHLQSVKVSLEDELLKYQNKTCTPEEEKPLLDWSAFPKLDTLRITAKGHPITLDPDRRSPANFSWASPEIGYINVTDDRTVFDVRVGSIHFSGELGHVQPWSDGGQGPAGWIDDLPLPLHWFVYSTHSPVTQYTWFDSVTGQSVRSNSGYAHMEKNWGNSFPKKWIWSQGLSPDATHSYALSYGPVTFGPVDVEGHLFGYKTLKNNKSALSFTPANSYITGHNQDGCKGEVNITITAFTLTKYVNLHLNAAPGSFSECVYGPKELGFEKCLVESYLGETEVEVYEKDWLLNWRLVDRTVFQKAALEFGGGYMCDPTCTEYIH